MVGRRRLTRNGPIQDQPAATLHAQPYDRGEHGFYGPSAGPITCRAHDTEWMIYGRTYSSARARIPNPVTGANTLCPTARTQRRGLSVTPQG